MRIRVPFPPLLAVFVIVVSVVGGCAPKKQALRAEGSSMAVRLTPVEVIDVRLRSERPESPPLLPFSVADEMRGRWLTLFEVTVSPVAAGNLPVTGSAEDPETPASGPAPDL